MSTTTIKAIARSLWLCAYADGIEEEEGGIDGPRPGAGEDWDDYAPDTPPEALATAQELVEQIGRVPIGIMFAVWRDLTGLDLEQFGHCVALQALGHGVGLSDDVPAGIRYARPELPDIEFTIWDVGTLPDGVTWRTGGADE